MARHRVAFFSLIILILIAINIDLAVTIDLSKHTKDLAGSFASSILFIVILAVVVFSKHGK